MSKIYIGLYFLYFILLLSLGVYSYALIDPNLTLFSTSWWVSFRDPLVYFGYYLREWSSILYVLLISMLFVFHFYFMNRYKKIHLVPLVIFISIVGIISIPFLSHDFFNYIFDAKILTFYGQNPYTHIPGSFPDDKWLRFMHWTHRSYPYGPVFLPLTLIPSFLGVGKFILNFIFFKILNVVFYILGAFFLQKINKKYAVIFATHPLVIIEGLINAHNDLIGVGFAIVGFYYLSTDKNIIGRVLLVLSAGVKYLTFPVVFLSKKGSLQNKIVLVAQIILVAYLCHTNGIQPWYFLTFFVYLPIFPGIITKFYIFTFVLLLSYFPYIRFGYWAYMDVKNIVILGVLIVNVGYILLQSYLPKKKFRRI